MLQLKRQKWRSQVSRQGLPATLQALHVLFPPEKHHDTLTPCSNSSMTSYNLPSAKYQDVWPALYLFLWNSPKAKWNTLWPTQGTPASLFMPNFGWPGRPAHPLLACPSDLPSLRKSQSHSFIWHLPRSTKQASFFPLQQVPWSSFVPLGFQR